MNWFSRLMGDDGATITVEASGKNIEIFCSAHANQALAKRAVPLIVELELAFACIARKHVRFHDTSPSNNVIEVNEKLALLITTIVPDLCEVPKAGDQARAAVRQFMPKWVRIDYVNGTWAGEYGL